MTGGTPMAQAVADAVQLIGQAEGLLAQARRDLQAAAGHQHGAPYLDAKTASRVEKLGEVAHRHKHGSMTRADSLAIRRQMFGGRVQATANLFGTADSGALFWRDQPYGTPVSDDDPIRLTAEGTRIADLWRATHQT
jgi:hypothetical protein